jgi:hypothetical protein
LLVERRKLLGGKQMKLSKNTTIKRLCDMILQAIYAGDPLEGDNWQTPIMAHQSLYTNSVYAGPGYYGALAIALVNIVGEGGYWFWLNTSEYPLDPSRWEENESEPSDFFKYITDPRAG